MKEYICRFNHIGHDSDHCRTCLRDNYPVQELPAAPAPEPAAAEPTSEQKPEELTPIIETVEGAPLPISKHHGRKR